MSEIESAEELAERWVRAGILDGVERTTVASDIRADRRRVLEMAAKVSEELLLSTDGSLWASGQLGGFVRQVLEHVAKRISALIEEVCK